MSDRPVVAFYREMLLNFNEPFIAVQGEMLTRYRSIYLGDRLVPDGLRPPPDRTFTVREGHHAADATIAQWVGRLPSPLVPRSVARGEIASRVTSAAFRHFGYSPWLARRLRESRASLLYAHTGLSCAQVLPLARRMQLPLVATYVGFETTGSDTVFARIRPRGVVYLRRRERMKREVDHFIAISRFLYDEMRAQGYPEERMSFLYKGIDLRAFQPAAEPPRERIVLFAGRLMPVKGLGTLLVAMQALQRENPATRLVIAGTGELDAELRREAARLAVNAEFLGARPPAEIRDWMRQATVLALPSIRDATGQVEALGAVTTEALASGLPIVASRVGGIPEVVDDRVTGLLVPSGDAESLARALREVLDDAALRARMSAAARERALRDFDIVRQTAKFEDLFDRVREARARRSPVIEP